MHEDTASQEMSLLESAENAMLYKLYVCVSRQYRAAILCGTYIDCSSACINYVYKSIILSIEEFSTESIQLYIAI